MRKKKPLLSLTVLMVIFGIMVSIQFNSLQKPKIRDTRDVWELREDLSASKSKELDLLKEIDKYDEMLKKYSNHEDQSKEAQLTKTLKDLKEKAGFTEVTGKGIEVEITQLFSKDLTGEEVKNIPPDLLKKLINEVNMFGAKHMSINDHRVINTSVIRDINGTTKMDGYSIDGDTVSIKIISQQADKLYSRLNVSDIGDLFAQENFSLSISQPKDKIHLKAYDGTIQLNELKPLDDVKEGKS
ncbi:NgoFVII family restriction endonuclease [Bacillus xiamenensis]|uniref:NgoFVII family restriction endonuclease n=1 Tax=Bacillus xiamenensis TaxID=1178537 RepID=A0AAC9N9R9_9BACI|nr:DUF881 domain-containing protein [Bacillus xiamenensis]AOZ87381.1 NgoFVII family restriction endonuclease [Bacillus xiamenensis]